ncbi:MAG: phosphatidylglycerophosphatase A [Bacteroidota bacterium]
MTSPAESPNPVNIPPPTTALPNFFVRAFASGLFSGYFPIASGTVGSLVGLAIYFLPGFEGPYLIMPASFAIFLLGVRAGDLMEAYYGHDPAEVTIDEVLGMWVSLFLLPKTLAVAVAAFFVFRFMDIVKPFPARKFDRLSGGFGIMMDDVVAGLYANIVIHLLLAVPFLGQFFV